MSESSQNGNSSMGALTDTGENQYICVVCNESFASNAQLTTHIRSAMRMEQNYCDECDQFTGREWIYPERRPFSRHESDGQNNSNFEYKGMTQEEKTILRRELDEEIRARVENLVNFVLSVTNNSLSTE